MPARILKFYIWIAYGKLAGPYSYTSNFGEVGVTYCFAFVPSSAHSSRFFGMAGILRTVHAKILKFYKINCLSKNS